MSIKLKEFSNPSIKTCVLGAQKNRLNETVLLSTNNICFWMRNKENRFPMPTLIWRPVVMVGTAPITQLHTHK